MSKKILITLVFIIASISTIQAKLSEYDVKQIDAAWNDKDLKGILKEIKKINVYKNVFEALRILDELRISYNAKEQNSKTILDEAQAKCSQTRNTIISEIKKLNKEQGIREGYATQNQSIQRFLQKLLVEQKDMQKKNTELLLELDEEKSQLSAILQKQLEKDGKISNYLEKVMKALVVVKNTRQDTNDYKSNVSQYIQVVTSVNQQDPLRLFLEGFNKSLLSDLLEILINLAKNNQNEQEYIQQSKDTMMKNFNEQRIIINKSINDTQKDIKQVENVLANFADLFEKSETADKNESQISLSAKEKKQIEGLESKKVTNETSCSKDTQALQVQYDSFKNRRQFVQVLIQYLKLDPEGVQNKISKLN